MKRIIFAALVLTSQVSVADWRLNNEASTLSFISTKNASVTEVHHFKELSGNLSDNGEASLTIGLNSVETNIPVRDDRLKQFFFETGRFNQASVAIKIDPAKVKALAMGAQTDIMVKAVLNLHGITQNLEAHLRVIKMQNNALAISTLEPIVLSVGLFDLQEGLDKLKELAKLNSITNTVPVSLNLVFESQ